MAHDFTNAIVDAYYRRDTCIQGALSLREKHPSLASMAENEADLWAAKARCLVNEAFNQQLAAKSSI